VIHRGVAVTFSTNNADGTCWSGAPNIGAY
jgi:hypothetical protein